MTTATLVWFSTGAILVYMVIRDPNLFDWLVLQSTRFSLELKRRWYMVKYHPDSPWIRWAVERNAKRLADEFIRERDKQP
jgi:hypothetical protein